MYRYPYEYEYSTVLGTVVSGIRFHNHEYQYGGAGVGDAKPRRKRGSFVGGRSPPPGNRNGGVPTRASPNSVEAHHPLFFYRG